MKLTEVIKQQIIEVLGTYPEIMAAYIHGSLVKGCAREDSDVDIAILPKGRDGMPLRRRLQCAADLQSVLGRAVDVGELSTGNLVYAREVTEHGLLLFSNNQFESERFIATCLSMYADLQVQRREVLESYASR